MRTRRDTGSRPARSAPAGLIAAMLALLLLGGGMPLRAQEAADGGALSPAVLGTEASNDAFGLDTGSHGATGIGMFRRSRLGVTGFEVPPALLGWRGMRAQQDAPVGAGGELRAPETYGSSWRFLRATTEIVGFNLAMTMFGRYLFTEGKEGFIVSLDSIHENLKAGMEWDDNMFSTNNFRHPVQGALYYNAGRANRYDFYQSSAFAFLGSWLWEYTGENHHPAVNDWINTAVGGIALGEMMWRFSDMILDNTKAGRKWSELGGFVVNPMRGLNRLITGEAFEVHANAPDRLPSSYDGMFRVGLRTIGSDRLWDQNSSKMYIAFNATYGSPFEEVKKPFDHFDFGAQLNVDNKPHGIGLLDVQGVLGAMTVSQSERSQHVLAAYQHFDYIDNEAYTYGGQSFGATFRSRFIEEGGFQARATLHANLILLGASSSDYFSISGREYDYGPGVGFKFEAAFERKGTDILTIGHESHVIRSVNGNEVDSYVNFTHVRAHVPIKSFFGAGLEYLLYMSERNYATLPDVSQRSPELRIYAGWGR